MEDEVELADIAESPVEGLDEDLDEVEDTEGRLGLVDTEDEVEGGVVAVDEVDGAPSKGLL